MITTAREAKACCTCQHWHANNEVEGLCKNPKNRWGVTYCNEETGKESHVEWWTVGVYATCNNYEAGLLK